jgi:hypothetical protein
MVIPIHSIKTTFRNPFIFGTLAGILVVLANLAIASLAEGSIDRGYPILLGNGIFTYLIPLAVSVQMGLYRYYRNITPRRSGNASEKAGVSGSMVSSLAMVACCAHHVSDLLPAIGLALAASSFLTQYKDAILVVSLAVNLIGSALIVNAIYKAKLSRDRMGIAIINK